MDGVKRNSRYGRVVKRVCVHIFVIQGEGRMDETAELLYMLEEAGNVTSLIPIFTSDICANRTCQRLTNVIRIQCVLNVILVLM